MDKNVAFEIDGNVVRFERFGKIEKRAICRCCRQWFNKRNTRALTCDSCRKDIKAIQIKLLADSRKRAVIETCRKHGFDKPVKARGVTSWESAHLQAIY